MTEETNLAHAKPRVVIVAGASGAGKTTLVESVTRHLVLSGIPYQKFSIGDVVRIVAGEEGLDPRNRKDLYAVSHRLMEELGNAGFVDFLIESSRNKGLIDWDAGGLVIWEGIRDPEEAQRIRELFTDTYLVYCYAPLKVRVERIQERDDVSSEDAFLITFDPNEEKIVDFFLREAQIVVAQDTDLEKAAPLIEQGKFTCLVELE